MRMSMEGAASQLVEDNKGGVELLYEDIEAPKFVDFTAADHYNPDDRYWFCARVGCDLRHEQEIDHEEINKNFILRVMAARSPNVKLRRALTANSSTTRKCPLTAPSKPSRPRMSRLAVMSSISRKLLDGKERPLRSANPITAPTPKQARVKKPTAVTGDALTTPRCKKRAVKPELFRSVRNPHKREESALASSEEEQNNRMVAKKALLFTSPKKKKILVGTIPATTTDDASVRKICRGMKKLDINGGQRLPLPSNTSGAFSRKKLGAREVKSRVYDALKSRNCKKGKENDSLLKKRRHVEEKQEESVSISLVVCHGSSSSSSGGESSDMEVDENSNRGSCIDKCSVEESELFEVPIVQDCLDDLRSKLPVQVEQLLPSSDGLSSCCNHGEEDVTDKEKDAEENVEREERAKSPKEKNRDVGGGHCRKASSPGDGDEDILESDDKENTSALDHNKREQNTESGRNILGKQEEKYGKSQKARVISKDATADVKSVKYSKPRPTNPKPFRLRTDERRVLKEANLEKKLLLTPVKEMNSVAVTTAAILNGTSSSKKAQGRVRRTKQQQALSHQPIAPSQNTEKRQLSVIKETAALNLKTTTPINKKKKREEAITNKSVAAAASSGSCSRSVARGRIRPTIPREPHFHTVSIPKTCCTKKWV